jgi:hypothetical protein
MKRRDFLKTPALGVLLPGAAALGSAMPEIPPPPDLPRPGGQKAEQRMHPDFKTFVDGIEYFYFGNGEIQGVLQFAPKDSEASFFGFTITDTEIFCRKWSSFLYHPERGFTNTRVGVTVGERAASDEARTGAFTGVKGYALTPDTFTRVEWKYPDGVPVVAVRWQAGTCEVEEEFSAPARGRFLFRTVNVKNGSTHPVEIRLGLTLYANFGLFDQIFVDEQTTTARAIGLAKLSLSCLHEKTTVAGRYEVRADLGTLEPGETKHAVYVYAIRDGEKILKQKSLKVLRRESAAEWAATTQFATGNGMLDGMFGASKAGVRSVIARIGKTDAGQWMYNMEWVSDHALAIEALCHAGMTGDARKLLERNLRDAVGKDGRTIESSRWFGYDYTELNQNGYLLWAAWVYYCWTGDIALIKKYWKKIVLCAEFPLKPVFFDEKARMVHNKREFWERNDTFGVEDGFELAYQFWVSHGLAKGAELARLVGDAASERRWSTVSAGMKDAILNDPVFRLIEDNHLIKRKKRNGQWQRYFIPPDPSKHPPGSPMATEERPEADPDTITSYPIIYGLVDPRGEIAQKTLDSMEDIWNQEWDSGGYPRYNVTGEDNPPAPWPLASLLVARANAEAGNDERVWKVLRWLNELNPHGSGSWFERYGQSITPPMPPVGIICWAWYEVLSLLVWHVAGVRPETDHCTLRPRLLEGLDHLTAKFMLRGRELRLNVRSTSGEPLAKVNGKEVPLKNGVLKIPYPVKGNIDVEMLVREEKPEHS